MTDVGSEDAPKRQPVREVDNAPKNRTIEERYGILAYPIKWYYRYTVMTGIYMLGPAETGFLHFFYVLGAYFLYSYVWSFIRDMEFFFGSTKAKG